LRTREITMEDARARELLDAERRRLESLLSDTARAGRESRQAEGEVGDIADPAESFISQEGGDAVAESLRARLAAVERAEVRLAEGTYGRSVRSGLPIPDERLEANPAAELTAAEERIAEVE
jgi:RNA polymerase-binding transcription factor